MTGFAGLGLFPKRSRLPSANKMLLPSHSLRLLFCLPWSHFARFRLLPSLVEGAPRFRDASPMLPSD